MQKQNIPNIKVIFFAFVRDKGITDHFCNMSMAVSKYADLLVVYNRSINSDIINLNRLKKAKIKCIDILELNKVVATNHEGVSFLFHCHGFAHLRIAIKLSRPTDKVLISVHCFRHARWFSKWVGILTYFVFFRSVDTWHFLCHKSRDEYFWYRKVPANTCAFPLGVEELFMEKTLEPCVMKDLDGEEIEDLPGRVNIVYIAQLQTWKRHHFLLRSLKPILRGNTFLFLIGEGNLLKKVMNLAEELGVRDNVIFTGRVDRKTIHYILSYTNLAVTVSPSETFGWCLLEPFCMNVPIVTTNVGIANSIIHDYHNGFILPTSCTEEEFLEKTRFALKNLRKIDNSGIKHLYHWDTYGRTTANCYESMFEGKSCYRQNDYQDKMNEKV
ncbi:MAG: glycosyltransferase [Candidatus Scalindua sp.]